MKNNFTDKLKSFDLKATDARKAVLDILTGLKHPIDAEELKILLDGRKISADVATVYRILKVFSDNNIIRKLSLQEGKTHYELI